MASEEQLVAQVLAGNKSEFRRLVERYQQPAFRFALNLVGNEHDAEDIAQESFIAAYDHLDSFNARKASMLTWLLTIVRNRCVNHLKRNRPATIAESITQTQPAATNDEPTRNEFWRGLDEALDGLPIEQKTAFVLAEIEDLSYAAIAQIEQTTLGTVKSRIHRAKQRLRAVLAPQMGER